MLIASLSLGLSTGVTRTVAIAASADQSGDDMVLTYQGGRDVPMLHRLEVTGATADVTPISASFAASPPDVGDTLTIPGAGTAWRDHVVVIAELVDGSRQVVLDGGV